VPVLQTDTELDVAFSDEKNLAVPVKHISHSLRSLLQIGLARSRERLRTLLDILAGMRLVTALKVMEEDPSQESSGAHPQKFEALTESDRGVMPMYWRFEDSVPLWKFSEPNTEPVLHEVVNVRTVEDAASYWSRARDLALRPPPSISNDVGATSASPEVRPLAPDAAASLPHQSRWKDTFLLTKTQLEHLYRSVKEDGLISEGRHTDRSKQLAHMAWVIAAPKQAVATFVEQCERAHERRRKQDTRSFDAAKRRFAEKSREAKAKLQDRWDLLVNSIYSGPVDENCRHRLDSLRDQYLSKGSFAQDARWRRDIQKALEGDNPFTILAPRRQPVQNGHSSERPGQDKSARELVMSMVNDEETSASGSRPKARKSLSKKIKKGEGGK
jgi:hypothetical protein